MNIAVNTFYSTSYEPLAEITIPNLQYYCGIHGYELFINKVSDEQRHFIKTKDAKVLLDKYDLVWTLENDILITSHKIKIESFIEDGFDFFLTKDINNFNGGSFITRATEFSKKWFDFVNSHEGKVWDEQTVFEQCCEDDGFKNSIKTLPQNSINSIPYDYYYPSYGKMHYKEGDAVEKPTLEQGNWEEGESFVCHLPGMTMQRRIEIFTELKNKIVL